MAYDTYKHHRRSIRLKGYDYSQAGAYFVTIRINYGQNRLGAVQEGVIVPSPAGELVKECWETLPKLFSNIDLDSFSLMPNHVHGIILIMETSLNASHNPILLGNMIGAFKSMSTNQYIDGVREKGREPFHIRLWQRDFYDRVIRNDRELETIQTYIVNNPANWVPDKLHPDANPNDFNKLWQRPLADDI